MTISHTNTGYRPTNRGIKQPRKNTRNVTSGKAESTKETKAPTSATIVAIREDYNFLGEKQSFMLMQKDRRLKDTIAAMSRQQLGKLHRRLNKCIDHYNDHEAKLREKHADDIAWLKKLRAEIQTARNDLRVTLGQKATAA